MSAVAEDALDLHRLIGGAWSTQVIGVAAELGIPDRLAAGCHDAGQLALELECNPSRLLRLLRALVALGVCREPAPSRFDLLPRGQLLRRGTRGSLAAWAVWSARYQWDRWGRLRDAMRENGKGEEPAGYAPLESDAASAAVFHEAMARLTEPLAAALQDAHDFSRWASVLDVGGGQGFLATALVEAHPHLRAVVQELPHARPAAEDLFRAHRVEDRCRFVGRSFFEGVEPECDVHILKSVLHNWDDGDARRLLRACVAALPRGGTLLVVERLMPHPVCDRASHRDAARADLNMLLGYGSRERTRAEFRELLGSCGLEPCSEQELGFGFTVLESRATSSATR